MSEFKNKSITSKGMELLSKALVGEPLEFTKIELGSGTYEGDLGFATGLVEVKQTLPINNLDRKGSQMTLSGGLKAGDIKEDFYWSEVGIYAKGADNIEYLYMYGYTTNTSYISKDTLNEKLIHITVFISNTAHVEATMDESLIYLTEKSLAKHNMDTHAHEEIRDKVTLLNEEMNLIKGNIANLNTGAVKKVTTYKGKISKIEGGVSYGLPIAAIDPNKSSINVLKCTAEFVVPYISSSTSVGFHNMSASTAYSSVVYGFEIIEYN